MTYPSPSPAELQAAFSDHGVRWRRGPKCNNGRDAWAHGLRAATCHHTAGKDSVRYLSDFNYAGANVCVTNGTYNPTDGEAVILCWGSAWHSGKGGPWPGVAGKDSLHLVSWGIEVESLGTRPDITDAQQDTVGRMLAALVDLGMPLGNIHRHADWTDGTPPVGGHPLPTVGRKIDTRKEWYPTQHWVDLARKYAGAGPAGEDDDDMTPEQIEALADKVAEKVWQRQFRDFTDRQPRNASWFLVNGGSVEAQKGTGTEQA